MNPYRAVSGLLDRYLLSQLWRSMLMVWLILTLLYTALQLIGQLRDMAGDYHLLDTLWYSLLTTPGRAYRLFPFAALAGVLICIGRLAAQEELIVMRMAGCSRLRMLRPVLLAVSLLLLIAMALGEWSGGDLMSKARNFRIGKITGQVSLADPSGLWLRDGDSMVHVLRPLMIGQQATDFYEFRIFAADQGRLCEWLDARHAVHMDGYWLLDEVTVLNVCAQPPTRQYHAQWRWPSAVETSLLSTAALRPSILATRDLLAYVDYLNNNGLDSYRYRNAFYRRLFYAPVALLLVWLALPLVMGPVRQLSRGRRLVLGFSVGLGMYMLQQLCESVAAVYRWHPVTGALVPILLGLGLGMWLYRRTI